jgi:hypothetical protein
MDGQMTALPHRITKHSSDLAVYRPKEVHIWGSLATLNRCLDLDVTFIDTANVSGGGNNGCNPADPRRAARMKEGST